MKPITVTCFYHIYQLLPAICQVSGKFICQQDGASAFGLVVYFKYILQGSVATLLRCSEIYNDHFIANFLQSVSMTEF